MRRVRFFHYLLLPLLLSGCFGFTASDGRPGMYGDWYFLDSLVGKTSEIVVREFGIPDELLFDGQTRHMVYSTRGSGTSQGFITYIPLPVTPTDDDAIKHCLRFELDNDNLVKAYKIKSKSTLAKWILLAPVGGGPVNCRDLFWTKQEQENLVSELIDIPTWLEVEKKKQPWWWNLEYELRRQAEQGNSEAQLNIFEDLSKKRPEVALVWLCRSADSGSQEARVILKNIFEYGGDPWIEKGIVEPDFRLAYVWHELSGVELYSSQAYLNHIASEEGQEAVKMLREWQPGNCERDLGLDGDELIKIN